MKKSAKFHLFWIVTWLLSTMILKWIIAIACISRLVYSDLNAIKYSNAWPDISQSEQDALRAQRDMARNMTIDQIPSVGVNLRSVLFNNVSVLVDYTQLHNNEMILLNSFESILNNGLQTFILDLQIVNNTWTITDSIFSLSDVLITVQNFFQESNHDSSVNFLSFLFNIAEYTDTNELTRDALLNIDNIPNLNLSLLLNTYISDSYFYKPSDLFDFGKGVTANITHISYNHTYQNAMNHTNATVPFNKTEIEGLEWPTLQNVLFEEKKRLMVTELTDILKVSNDSYIFPNYILNYERGDTSFACPSKDSEINEVKKLSWRFLESEFDNTTIRNYLTCGLSPIVSNFMYIDNVTDIVPLIKPALLWSWQVNEPKLTNSKLLLGKDSITPNNCALMKYYESNNTMLLYSNNCYHNKYGLCQKNNDSREWLITTQQESFFNFYDIDTGNNEKNLCPSGYTLSIPTTPIDQLSLSFYIQNSKFRGKDIEFWVDMNSIMVSNCWVVGGPNVTCPYAKVASDRNFLAMVLPISIVAFLLAVLDLYLSVQNVPIHDNRKNWRRIVNSVSKTEFEGVPS